MTVHLLKLFPVSNSAPVKQNLYIKIPLLLLFHFRSFSDPTVFTENLSGQVLVTTIEIDVAQVEGGFSVQVNVRVIL